MMTGNQSNIFLLETYQIPSFLYEKLDSKIKQNLPTTLKGEKPSTSSNQSFNEHVNPIETRNGQLDVFPPVLTSKPRHF